MMMIGGIYIVLIGVFAGVIRWMYMCWKTKEWFSFITKYQPSIDEDTDWWTYNIYKKYPILALIMEIVIYGLIGAAVALVSNFLGGSW